MATASPLTPATPRHGQGRAAGPHGMTARPARPADRQEQTQRLLTYSQAQRIVERCIEIAERDGLTVAVAVADGGDLLVVQRTEQPRPRSPRLSHQPMERDKAVINLPAVT